MYLVFGIRNARPAKDLPAPGRMSSLLGNGAVLVAATHTQLFQCLICDHTFDCEGRYVEGYEPGEIEFVPLDDKCPECSSTEIEAI